MCNLLLLVVVVNDAAGRRADSYLQSLVVLAVGDVQLSRHVDEVIADQAGVSHQSFF